MAADLMQVDLAHPKVEDGEEESSQVSVTAFLQPIAIESTLSYIGGVDAQARTDVGVHPRDQNGRSPQL